MSEKTQYFVVKQKAVPEVLLRVVEAKRLLDTKKAVTVQEAADQVGISRSSFYKYKDDIFPFHENAKGKTITFVIQMNDEPGLLSDVLKVVAEHRANILTNSSEYSHQWHGIYYAERGGASDNRECVRYDRYD